MKFSVNTAALPGLAGSLDRRWQDFVAGRGYLADTTHLSIVGPGVLNAIFGSHQQIVHEIDAFLSAAAQGRAGPFCTAIDEALVSYRHSDHAAAVRTDAALPGAGAVIDVADQRLGPEVFADPVHPGARYTPPPDHRADHPYRFSCFDLFSPTSWGREAIWRVTGIAARFGLLDRPYDVLTEAVEPLCGDWAGYLGAADAYDNIALALGDVAACLTDGAHTTTRVWTGNAADACTAGLDRFAVDVAAAVRPLQRTAETYRTVAEQIYAEAETVAAVLTLLLDEIIESALEPATGGLIAELQLVTTAFDIGRILTRIAEVGRLVGKAKEVATAGMNTATSSLHAFGVITDSNPVPAIGLAVPALPRVAVGHAA